MLELVILSYMLTEFMFAFLGKFNMFERFKVYTSRGNSRLLYNLSNCMFCMHFHLSVISSLLMACFFENNLTHLLTPVFVSGLRHTIYGSKN